MIFFNEISVLLLLASSVLFWMVPERFRSKFLIAGSFTALAFIQLKFSIFLIFLVLFVFLGGKAMQRSSKGKWLTALVVILVILLLGFKYMGEVFALLFSGESHLAKMYLVPLGISYLVFKLIAFVIDVYRGVIENPSFEELLAFIFFLPIFPAGPIERYQNFAFNRMQKFDSEFYVAGLRRLTIGYFKKVLLVNFLLYSIVSKKLYPIIMANGVSLDLSASTVLMFLVGSLLYAYVDLSSYADIAIGYGQLYGYKICENMNYPLFRKNMSDYWDSWHISLSHWCRNNVYFPVLGSTRNIVLALFASFIVMGLWHNVGINWTLWGMWHATGVTIYSKWNRFKKKKKLRGKLPKPLAYGLGMIITVLYASMGYSVIMIHSTREALRVVLALFV